MSVRRCLIEILATVALGLVLGGLGVVGILANEAAVEWFGQWIDLIRLHGI
jgi:hypothetical protein